MRPQLKKEDEEVAALAFAQARPLLQLRTTATYLDTIERLRQTVLLADKPMPIRAFFDVVRQMQAKAGLPLCLEDEFMLAVGFLGAEVSKVDAGMTYLIGESPDYREFKPKRNVLDTQSETSLKTLSSRLMRPNEERGNTELERIQSAVNRMSKLYLLHGMVPTVVKLLKAKTRKNEILKRVRIGLLDTPLSLNDFDVISRMAHRAGVLPPREGDKEPENRYILKNDHHTRVVKIASSKGITPRRALNGLLDDLFVVVNTRERFKRERKPKDK